MSTNLSSPRCPRHRALALLAAALCWPIVLTAQQQPITGQMMEGRKSTPPFVQRDAATLPPTQRNTPSAQAADAPLPDVSRTAAASSSADVSSANEDFASRPSYYATRIGDTTRHLLQMQTQGNRADPPLPTLGVQASAAYQRYLKSFEHPIPEFYDTTVGKKADSGR